jgi:4-hydroxybenzoate polyprenyltransferase
MLNKIKIWAEMVKIEHTIFSAPFMLSSMLLAAGESWPKLATFLWASLALLGARSAAMSLNRLIDWQIDALNPRTADRAIPAGKLTPQSVLILSIVGFVLLTISALNLPKLCLYLLPIAVVWLSFYSFAKRFSWLAHYILGIALGGAVLGGWIAVTGKFAWPPVFIGLGVTFWVAGFDILYAIQDLDFDKEQKLHSIPSKLGLEKAILVSKVTHFISLLFFIRAATLLQGIINTKTLIAFWLSIFILTIGLIIEHALIKKDLKNINLAFFTANAYISSLFFICILCGKLL